MASSEPNEAQAQALGRLAKLLPHEPQFTLSACRQEKDTLRMAIKGEHGHHGYVILTREGIVREMAYRC